jgi:hypothetical protein
MSRWLLALFLALATLPVHGKEQKPPQPQKPFAERWLDECGARSRPRPTLKLIAATSVTFKSLTGNKSLPNRQ